MYSMPYKTRTGNSHGVTKDKLPAKVPCKRATAGAKRFIPDEQPPPRKRAMLVNGLTGRSVMVDA